MKTFFRTMILAALLFTPLAMAKGEAQAGLVETLKSAGRFSTYLSLQEAAKPDPNVVGATQGQRTFFVPSDAAFAKLPPGTVERLRDDPERLNSFLQTLTLPDRMTAAGMIVVAVRPPADRVVKKLNGRGIEVSGGGQGAEQQIRVRVVGDKPVIGKKRAVGARVGSYRDVLVAEGVVHEIDAVLASEELGAQ